MQRRVAILPVRTSPLPSERPEAQEGLARRPRARVQRPGPRSSRRGTGEDHEPKLTTKLLTSTLRPKTPAQPANRKGSFPKFRGGRSWRQLIGRAARCFPQAARLFARRRPMGRGRNHIAPFPTGPQPAQSSCYRPSRAGEEYGCTS